MKYIAFAAKVMCVLMLVTLVGMVALTHLSNEKKKEQNTTEEVVIQDWTVTDTTDSIWVDEVTEEDEPEDTAPEDAASEDTDTETEAEEDTTEEDTTEEDTTEAPDDAADDTTESATEAWPEDSVTEEDTVTEVVNDDGKIYTGTMAKGHHDTTFTEHDVESELVYVADRTEPAVALTFDDGPSEEFTNAILSILDQYDAKATFFVLGYRAKLFPSEIQRAYDLGCQIGNHTYSHVNLTTLSEEKMKEQVERTNEVVQDIIGTPVTVVRPPYGSANDKVLGMLKAPAIYWSLDTRDWESRNTAAITTTVMQSVKDGDIILMHDLYDTTVEATEELVPYLLNNGYQLLTVEELAALKGFELENGKKYSSFGR